MLKCRVCGNKIERELLAFGAQPVCNRFAPACSTNTPCYPLGIMQCPACALIQLTEMRSPDELRPTLNWIVYNEPEGHLDAMVNEFLRVIPLRSNAKILGITYKDDSTIERFRQHGFRNTCRLESRDVGVTAPCAGLETLQAQLAAPGIVFPEYAYKADVVIARHLLEHTGNPRSLLSNLAMLLNPNGILLIEAPGITPALQAREHVVVWEEHSMYFTAATLHRCMATLGFKVLMKKTAEYSMENCHILAVQPTETPAPTQAVATEELQLAQDFADTFPIIKDRLHKWFDAHHAQRPRALMGAGHLACKFINFYGLQNYIDMVIDDNPEKQGLFMPGSHQPINPSTALVTDDVKLCLMAVNPLNEDKVIDKQTAFTQNGGIFASIFAGSKRFILQ